MGVSLFRLKPFGGDTATAVGCLLCFVQHAPLVHNIRPIACMGGTVVSHAYWTEDKRVARPCTRYITLLALRRTSLRAGSERASSTPFPASRLSCCSSSTPGRQKRKKRTGRSSPGPDTRSSSRMLFGRTRWTSRSGKEGARGRRGLVVCLVGIIGIFAPVIGHQPRTNVVFS